MTAKSSAPVLKPAGRRPLAENADDRELVGADPHRFADRINVREKRFPRCTAEHDHLSAVFDFGRQEKPPRLQLRKIDRRPVLGRAENRQLLRPSVTKIDARTIVAHGAEPDVHQGHGRTVARYGARIFDRDVRAAGNLEEALSGCPAERPPLLHHDRIRAELADRIAQRLIETANEGRHPDDRRDADDHAKNRQGGSHLARPQRVERHADDFTEQAGAEGGHVIPASMLQSGRGAPRASPGRGRRTIRRSR